MTTRHDPAAIFQSWLNQAKSALPIDHKIMTLATVTESGRPRARIVYYNGFDKQGLRFFTNKLSQKGADLESHPFAAVVFHWRELSLQVRIEGAVEHLSREDALKYWQSRSLEKQASSAASPQSQPIPNIDFVANRAAGLLDEAQSLGHSSVEMPEHWGGYVIKPDLYEFWQGSAIRLHKREQFQWREDRWLRTCLAP